MTYRIPDLEEPRMTIAHPIKDETTVVFDGAVWHIYWHSDNPEAIKVVIIEGEHVYVLEGDAVSDDYIMDITEGAYQIES